MKRFEFLASVAVALGMGKLFPSLLHPQTEIFVLEWGKAEGLVQQSVTMSLHYRQGDRWVLAGTAQYPQRLEAIVPKDYKGDYRIAHTYSTPPKALTPR